MKVGIVIVNYNNAEDTLTCVKSLEKLSKRKTPYVVYVVDNHSRKSVRKKLLRKKEFTLIKSQKNLGFAGGNNLGIIRALEEGCTHVLLLNNDAKIIDPNTLEKLLAKNKNGISAPVIMFKRFGKKVYDYGGSIDMLLGRNTHYEYAFRINRLYPKADYYSGACLLMSAEVFNKIGLLNSEYFLYYEDAEFCLKAADMGIKLSLQPDVVVSHKLSASTKKLGKKSLRILANSHFRFCLNNLPPTSTMFFLLFNLYLRFKAF